MALASTEVCLTGRSDVIDARNAISRKADCEGSWDVLGRALFALDQFQELADLANRGALEANGDDYNVYIPYGDALTVLGRTKAARTVNEQFSKVLEQQVQWVPEDTRARIHLASNYVRLGRRTEGVVELKKVLELGSTDPLTIYNMACAYANLEMKQEALGALRKAVELGYSDSNMASRDPDLRSLREAPEFKRLLEDMKRKR